MAKRNILMATPTKSPELVKSEASSALKAGSMPNAKAHTDIQLAPSLQIKKVAPIKSIEDWAESVISSKQNEIGSPTISLSRFGLKNAKDVITFLKSPGGEATIAEIGAEIDHKEAIKEQQRLYIQEHNLLMHRIRALLFLWFVEEKSHAADKLRDFIEKQNTRLLKEEARIISSSNPRTDTPEQKALQETLATYDKAIGALADKLTKNTDQGKNLEELMNILEDKGSKIEEKYNEFESELNKLEVAADTRENFSEAEIEAQLKVLELEAFEIGDKITQSIEANDDDAINALKIKLNALELKAATLSDMKAVHKSEKYYADADGNKVTSFKDAHFILKQGKTEEHDEKLIKVDNKLYLLKPGQTWDSIKDNPIEKNEARNNYKLSKQACMSVKKVVQHHKDFEKTVHKAHVSETEKQIDQNKSERLLLKNQVLLVQSARASAEHALQQPNLGQEPPKPTPTAGSASTPKPNQSAAYYKQELDRLKHSPHISRKELFDLANQTPGPNKKHATDFLKQEFTKLPQRGPIPQTTMQTLLQTLERLGAPSAPSKQKKHVEEEPYKSPTPFSTKP